MLKGLLNSLFHEAISKKFCFACTRRLDKQRNREAIDTETEMVICKCGKTYIYDRIHRQYSIYQEQRPTKIYAWIF